MIDTEWPPFATTDREQLDARRSADPGGELPAAYARCFATADGRRVLADLKRRTFARVYGPDASEAVLRHAEGQRQLVAGILALVQRGGGPEI